MGFFDIFPFGVPLLSQLLIIFYFYAALGLTFFGGDMTSETNIPDIFPALGKDYIFMNFNDFLNAFSFVFHLVIVNNTNNTVNILNSLTYG